MVCTHACLRGGTARGLERGQVLFTTDARLGWLIYELCFLPPRFCCPMLACERTGEDGMRVPAGHVQHWPLCLRAILNPQMRNGDSIAPSSNSHILHTRYWCVPSTLERVPCLALGFCYGLALCIGSGVSLPPTVAPMPM